MSYESPLLENEATSSNLLVAIRLPEDVVLQVAETLWTILVIRNLNEKMSLSNRCQAFITGTLKHGTLKEMILLSRRCQTLQGRKAEPGKLKSE